MGPFSKCVIDSKLLADKIIAIIILYVCFILIHFEQEACSESRPSIMV